MVGRASTADEFATPIVAHGSEDKLITSMQLHAQMVRNHGGEGHTYLGRRGDLRDERW